MAKVETWTVWNDFDAEPLTTTGDDATPISGGAQFVFVNPATSGSRFVILLTYLATCALGVTGNVLVLYAIVGHRQLRVKSVANYYIGNLALERRARQKNDARLFLSRSRKNASRGFTESNSAGFDTHTHSFLGRGKTFQLEQGASSLRYI